MSQLVEVMVDHMKRRWLSQLVEVKVDGLIEEKMVVTAGRGEGGWSDRRGDNCLSWLR